MTNFVLTNLVSLLCFQKSIHCLISLGFKCLNPPILLPFLWNPNSYREKFSGMKPRLLTDECVAIPCLWAGKSLFPPRETWLGSHYSLPGKLGYHYGLTMLFHTDQLRGHLIHQHEERNHCFLPFTIGKGNRDTSCPFCTHLIT